MISTASQGTVSLLLEGLFESEHLQNHRMAATGAVHQPSFLQVAAATHREGADMLPGIKYLVCGGGGILTQVSRLNHGAEPTQAIKSVKIHVHVLGCYE